MSRAGRRLLPALSSEEGEGGWDVRYLLLPDASGSIILYIGLTIRSLCRLTRNQIGSCFFFLGGGGEKPGILLPALKQTWLMTKSCLRMATGFFPGWRQTKTRCIPPPPLRPPPASLSW